MADEFYSFFFLVTQLKIIRKAFVIIRSVRLLARWLLRFVQLFFGLLVWRARHRTLSSAHSAMVDFFCLSGGWSNDFISWLTSRNPLPKELPDGLGVIAVPDDATVNSLKNRGFLIFDAKLATEYQQELLNVGLNMPCWMRVDDKSTNGRKPVLVDRFDRSNPKAPRYDFSDEVLMRSRAVQEIVFDPCLYRFASAYLKCTPVIDLVAMWWHTNAHDEPDANAAQLFHFDMDRPKWLKIFIYLTDVTSRNGPHTFVEGTHVNCGIPLALRRKGYARITDQEVADALGGSERIIEFCAEAALCANQT